MIFLGLVSKLWVECVPKPLQSLSRPAMPMGTNCATNTIVNRSLPQWVQLQRVQPQRVRLERYQLPCQGIGGWKNSLSIGFFENYVDFFFWLFGLIFLANKYSHFYFVFHWYYCHVAVQYNFLVVWVYNYVQIYVELEDTIRRNCILKKTLINNLREVALKMV